VSDPLADAQLELACRVGSIEAIDEALEEGADIDFGGGTPLFVAITAHDRSVVEALVERGADVSGFGLSGTGDREALVVALLGLAPAPPEAGGGGIDGGGGGGAIDPKVVGGFDRAICKGGLAAPLLRGKHKGDIATYRAFADALRVIAAEERHACVAEFLGFVAPAFASADDEEGEEPGQLIASNAGRVLELEARYRAADEAPADLAREYLKEQKLIEKGGE
jgi:hypothetical protein